LPLQAEGEFALVKEKLELALELSGQPVKRGTMAHRHIVYMMLAEAAAHLGDVTALRGYASKLESLAVQDDHQPYLAIAHRAWGIACRLEGDYDDADARFTKALGLFDKLEFRWQVGRTLYEMAKLDLARSDQARAHEHFNRALEEFELMGAMPDVEQTQTDLAALA
jgi:tetratricopeptide (TPR) repeat protein